MRKKPYSEATVRSTISCVKSIACQANVNDPKSVKECVAKSPVSQNRKLVLIDTITRYYNFKQTPFRKPIYRKILHVPFIPLEKEIDDLISGTSKKVSVFLLLLKETGLRCGEAWSLKWTEELRRP